MVDRRKNYLHFFSIFKHSGDFSQAVSVICSTNSMTAVGSTGIELQPGADFIGREETNSYRVVFPQDVRQTTCLVKVSDLLSNYA